MRLLRTERILCEQLLADYLFIMCLTRLLCVYYYVSWKMSIGCNNYRYITCLLQLFQLETVGTSQDSASSVAYSIHLFYLRFTTNKNILPSVPLSARESHSHGSGGLKYLQYIKIS